MTATISHPVFPRLSRHAVLMALFLFAGSLWLNSRHNDFPFSYHPDEAGKTGQIIGGIRNYHHPLLMLSVTDIVARVAFIPREPQPIVETGRWVSAAFAAGTVATLALLAWLQYGALVAWGTGLAVALQVDLFETAHYMKEDPTLLFGIALSLLAAHLWWRSPDRRTLRFFAIACGLAVSGKYLGIVVLLFALPMVAWCPGAAPDLLRGTRLRRFALAFALTFLLCNLPIFATHLSSPFRSIGNEVNGVAGGHRGITREIPHSAYLETLHENVPPLLLLLAGVYALTLLVTLRRRSLAEWVTLLFPLGFLAVISCSPKIADRYLLPVSVLIPFLAILGVAEIGRTIDSEKLRARRYLSWVVIVGLSAAVAWAEWPGLRRSFEGYRHDDPAAVAAWITANLPPDAVLAEDHRVNLSPTKANGESTNARIPQKVFNSNFVADLGTLDELRAKGVTHVVICKQTYGRYFRDETKPREGVKTAFDKRREFYARVLEEGQLVKQWPQGKISYLQPGIKLFQVAPVPK